MWGVLARTAHGYGHGLVATARLHCKCTTARAAQFLKPDFLDSAVAVDEESGRATHQARHQLRNPEVATATNSVAKHLEHKLGKGRPTQGFVKIQC